MKKIAKILSIVVSTILLAVSMTACGEVEEAAVCEPAAEMQEKLANAGYSSTVELDINANVSIVAAKCDLSFKYAGKEKIFYTDWVSGDWYETEEDAIEGMKEAQKVQGNLILKRDGTIVYMGTAGGIELFEHDIPANFEEGKAVMQAANYTVADANLSTLEVAANATKKYTAISGDDKLEVIYFEDLLFAADFYSKNKVKHKDKVFEKQGHYVYYGTAAAVSTYKGLENMDAVVDSYKTKMESLGYNAYGYKKGKAGAIKAKKKGNSGDYDIQVAWFTNEASATEAFNYLNILYGDNIKKNQIIVKLEGKALFVATEQALADFNS